MRHLLIIALCSATAWTAEYWVATDGVDAPERGNAPDQPLATIRYAVERATQPGDIVTVRAGTYRNEEIVFTASGSEGRPITLRGEDEAEVVIKGSTIVPDAAWSKRSPGVWQARWSFHFGAFDKRLMDEEEENDPDPKKVYNRGNLYPRNRFFVDGRMLDEVARVDDLRDGSFCIDRESKLVQVRLAQGASPVGRLIEGTSQESPLIATWGHSDLVIRNLQLRHLGNGTQGNAAVRVSGPFGAKAKRRPGGTNERVLVEDVSICWTAGTALSVSGRKHIVRRCILDDNGQNGLHVSGAKGCRFEEVRWRRNNTHPGKQFDWGWEAVMKLASSQDCVFDRCEAADNHGMGFWVDGPWNRRNVLMNSVIRGNAAQGVRLEISLETTVVNNLIVGNRQAAIEISASMANRIVNNTIVGNWTNAIGVGRYEGRFDDNTRAMSSYGNIMLNNIVVDNQRDRYGKSWIYSVDPKDSSAILPTEIKDGPPYSPNRSDHNWFGFTDPKENGREFFICGGRFNDLATYQKATGQDAHSRWGDPGFVDAAKGDFRLRADSPARGMGSDEVLAIAPADAAGVVRTAGAIDPGAWQAPRP